MLLKILGSRAHNHARCEVDVVDTMDAQALYAAEVIQ